MYLSYMQNRISTCSSRSVGRTVGMLNLLFCMYESAILVKGLGSGDSRPSPVPEHRNTLE